MGALFVVAASDDGELVCCGSREIGSEVGTDEAAAAAARAELRLEGCESCESIGCCWAAKEVRCWC